MRNRDFDARRRARDASAVARTLEAQIDEYVGRSVPQLGLLDSTARVALDPRAAMFRMAGPVKAGVGALDLAYDPTVDAAHYEANPYTSYIDANGRGYRLVANVAHARMWRIVEDDPAAAVENAKKIQSAIDWCALKVASGQSTGYTLSFAGMGVIYHAKFILKQGVLLEGGRDAGRGGRRGGARLIPTGIADNDFAIATPGSEKIFHFGLSGFHIQGGGGRSKFSGILVDNASDGCFERNQIDNFGLRCMKFTGTSGVCHVTKLFTQGLFNTALVTEPSGGVEVAGADHFFTGCEFSGPSQYVVSSSALNCAAVKCDAVEGTFLDCVFQTGDVGIGYVGTRIRYVACRFDTNAGHGMRLAGGDRCIFTGCTWVRNSFATIGQAANIVGSIENAILTVTSITSKQLAVGDTLIIPSGINCVVTGFGTGTGELGTYVVSVPQTVAAGTAMTGRTFYDHINVPDGFAAAGRCVFADPIFSNNGAALMRYCINDQRSSADYRNYYRGATGDAGQAAFYNLRNFSDVTIDTGMPLALPTGVTPSVLNGSNYVTANTISTAITGFRNGVPGQRLTIFPNDSFTSFVHGSGIALAQGIGSIKPVAGGLPIEFVFQNGIWRQIGGDGTAAFARLATLERAAYDFGAYDAVRASGILIGTDSNADGLSDGLRRGVYGSNNGNTHRASVAGGLQLFDLTADGTTPTSGRRLEAIPALVNGSVYLAVLRLEGCTPSTQYEMLRDYNPFIRNLFTDANGAASASMRFTATAASSIFSIGLPAFGGATAGSFRLGIRNLLVYNLSMIEAATGYPATSQTDAQLLALFLGTIDRAPKVTGWTAGTGVALKSAYATYTKPALSSPPTLDEMQAAFPVLVAALEAASQRLLAIEQSVRAGGIIN